MTEQATERATGPTRRVGSRLRTIFAVVFGIVAVVGLFASTVAVWANGVLFDSDKVATAAEKALQEPEAAASMATYVSAQVFSLVDLETLLEDRLPGDLDPIAGVLVGGAREFVEGQLTEVLQKPAVQRVLVSIIRTSHAQLMKVLNGEGLVDGVSIEGDTVTLNVLPVVTLGLNQVQKLGLLGDITVPQLKVDGDPVQQIAELEAAFGRDLPATFGQLVVFRGDAAQQASDMVEQAQNMLVLVKRAIAVILAITIVCFVLSIVVANRHRRAILVLGLASAAVMLIARTVIKQVLVRTPDLVVNPGARSALASALEELAGGLLELVTLLLLLGVIAAVAVVLTGAAGAGARALLVEHREVGALVAFALATLVIAVFGLDLVPLATAGALAVAGVVALVGRRPDVAGPAGT